MNNPNLTPSEYCPCCGHQTITELGVYEICSYCGWEDDPVQSFDPDCRGGANKNSLNEARKVLATTKQR